VLGQAEPKLADLQRLTDREILGQRVRQLAGVRRRGQGGAKSAAHGRHGDRAGQAGRPQAKVGTAL